MDPKWRWEPLDNDMGEGFRAQHSLLATTGLWIVEVPRVQATLCSSFCLALGSFWVW